MKKLFRIKIENLQLIGSILGTLIVLYANIVCGKDIKLIIALLFCVFANIYVTINYNAVKEFRKEVLRRW